MTSATVRPSSTWSRAAATFVYQSERLLPVAPMTASSPLDPYNRIHCFGVCRGIASRRANVLLPVPALTGSSASRRNPSS